MSNNEFPVAVPPSRRLFVSALALLALGHAVWFAIAYAAQLPLDRHPFRQSQTAVSVYWMLQQGFALAYETPVAGAPWSIPFEFPLYQYVVAQLVKWLPLDLPSAGRLLSFTFLLATCLPARDIARTLRLPRETAAAFAVLLLTSPVYLYWGRGFMIETAAVFFVACAAALYARYLTTGLRPAGVALLVLAATAGLLQKITTAFPVLLVLGCVHAVLVVKDLRAGNAPVAVGRFVMGILIFVLPMCIGYGWTFFTDVIKAQNALGRLLTSAALSQWNWGTLAQRLSADLWQGVLWDRMLAGNLGGAAGLLLLAWSALGIPRGPCRTTFLLAAVMGLLPLLLFTNLHIVHDYYQTANLVFLLFAAATGLAWLLDAGGQLRRAGQLFLLLIAMANVLAFSKVYLPAAQEQFDATNSRDVEIGTLLRRELPQQTPFLAFGNDWTSTLAYVAERKSFNVPHFFPQYADVLARPQDFLGGMQPGAVVVCPARNELTIGNLLASPVGREAEWAIGLVHGCAVAVKPETAVLRPEAATASSSSCEGGIDFTAFVQVGDERVALVAGWNALSAHAGTVPDVIHIGLTAPDGRTRYLRALRTHRPDINSAFKTARDIDFGFARILPADLAPGRYKLHVVRTRGAAVELCQSDKFIDIPQRPGSGGAP